MADARVTDELKSREKLQRFLMTADKVTAPGFDQFSSGVVHWGGKQPLDLLNCCLEREPRRSLNLTRKAPGDRPSPRAALRLAQHVRAFDINQPATELV
ncbi:hypothetical protein [Elioraea tepidiphila]|jgi:hypothetical protein|uniref:hypothetical protein n=1 Tax=Elioraea tepidiphila TaxID=457934 RepID=UPI0012EC62E0|nr:hypothetical protein [Elioraea tepidiphila]